MQFLIDKHTNKPTPGHAHILGATFGRFGE